MTCSRCKVECATMSKEKAGTEKSHLRLKEKLQQVSSLHCTILVLFCVLFIQWSKLAVEYVSVGSFIGLGRSFLLISPRRIKTWESRSKDQSLPYPHKTESRNRHAKVLIMSNFLLH